MFQTIRHKVFRLRKLSLNRLTLVIVEVWQNIYVLYPTHRYRVLLAKEHIMQTLTSEKKLRFATNMCPTHPPRKF